MNKQFAYCLGDFDWAWKKQILAKNRGDTFFDAVQDQPHISVPKTSELKSGPRVVKMVLNIQCYLIYFYGLQCDFMQKNRRKKTNCLFTM